MTSTPSLDRDAAAHEDDRPPVPGPKAPTREPAELPVVDIAPSHRAIAIELGPLWRQRPLLYFLTWRDLKVRYKQTLLGPSWVLLQPILSTVVFAIFFGRVAHVSSGGVPYVLYAFLGLLPWTFFANGVTNGSASLVNAASIITKVYFPRALMPVATVLGAAVDLLCSAVVLVPLLVYYGVDPSLRLLTIPLFLVLAAVPTLGVTLFLAALNVRYRDVKYVIPFLVQIWFFASPVVYSAKSLHAPWNTLYELNPMVGVLEGFRWAIVGAAPAPGVVTLVSAAMGAVFFMVGAAYLRHVDQSMSDII